MSDVNYKISEGALICVNSIVDQLNEDLRPHLSRVVPAVLERLGDNKNVVREKALDTLLSIFCFMDPNEAGNVLSDGFAHKNYKVRESVCIVLFLCSIMTSWFRVVWPFVGQSMISTQNIFM